MYQGVNGYRENVMIEIRVGLRTSFFHFFFFNPPAAIFSFIYNFTVFWRDFHNSSERYSSFKLYYIDAEAYRVHYGCFEN